MRGQYIAVVALAALALGGCANNGGFGPNRDTGIFDMGATAPATTGSTSAPSTAAAPGRPITASLDERDRARAYAAEMQALEYGEPGVPTGWRGDGTGRHGTIIPGASYDRAGTRCRDFTHSIYIDGRPQASRITACRNPDGTWTPTG